MADPKEMAEIRYCNARMALETIQELLDELYAKHEADPFNWGVVGELGRYEAQLMRLVIED